MTVNGEPTTAELNCEESQRPTAESAIARFDAGQMPMEERITFGGEIFIRGQRTNRVAWRWADVKKIWIEES